MLLKYAILLHRIKLAKKVVPEKGDTDTTWYCDVMMAVPVMGEHKSDPYYPFLFFIFCGDSWMLLSREVVHRIDEEGCTAIIRLLRSLS